MNARNNTRLTLRPDQQADVRRFLDADRKVTDRAGLNASTVGAGKTLTAVTAAIESGARCKLIVAPLNTFDGWERTIRLQDDERLRFVTTKNPEAIVDFREGKPGWYFGGWEFLRRYSLQDVPIDFLIGDEVHRAQNRKSKNFEMFSETAQDVADRGGWRMALSATPYGNRPAGAYGVCHSLWPKRRDLKFHAFWPFVDQYMGKTHTQWAVEPNKTEYVPGQIANVMPMYWRHAQGYQCCAFHPVGIQADLPKRVKHQVKVELTAAQRKIYADLERQMFAWIEKHDIPVTTQGYPIVLSMRLRQVCLAVPTPEMAKRIKIDAESGDRTEIDYVSLRYEADAKGSKLDAVQDIMEDIPEGERVLILTHSAGIIPAILARLEAQHIEAAGWHGAVSQQTRQTIKDSFINGAPNNGGDGSGVQVIVAQIGAIGEGVDGLQWACSNEIWFSMDTNGLLNVQAAGRLVRDGQKFAVNSWSLEADGTVEEDQLESLRQQESYMSSALNQSASVSW